jgi:hypothetical protein
MMRASAQNTISGDGQSDNGAMTLINEAHGTINANVAGGTLILAIGQRHNQQWPVGSVE